MFELLPCEHPLCYYLSLLSSFNLNQIAYDETAGSYVFIKLVTVTVATDANYEAIFIHSSLNLICKTRRQEIRKVLLSIHPSDTLPTT